MPGGGYGDFASVQVGRKNVAIFSADDALALEAAVASPVAADPISRESPCSAHACGMLPCATCRPG